MFWEMIKDNNKYLLFENCIKRYAFSTLDYERDDKGNTFSDRILSKLKNKENWIVELTKLKKAIPVHCTKSSKTHNLNILKLIDIKMRS